MATSRQLPVEGVLSNVRVYVGDMAGRVVVVLDGEGGFGVNSASRFAASFLANDALPRPAFVIQCGICWGNPYLTDLEDVLVATTVYCVNKTESMPDGTRVPKATILQTPIPPHVLTPVTGAGVVVGADFLSVEELLQSTQARDGYLRLYPTAAGGDMEEFVVIPSCHALQIPWLIIKGVPDFGDNQFERSKQAIAAEKAAGIRTSATSCVAARYSAPRATWIGIN
jgi:nucleoside phosphorylase